MKMPLRSRQRIAGSGSLRASGFSMIEVLIALLVLAFGLLGFALLQTLNLRYTQSSNYRTVATNLAYDLLDQMRASRLTTQRYTAATFAAGSVTATACSRPTGAGVTEAQNITRWQCQVVSALGPQAAANVTYMPGTSSGIARVSITWGERLAASPNTTFVVTTQL